MLKRLLETHYFDHRETATPAQIRFWLRELRNPELLIELAGKEPKACHSEIRHRPLLIHASSNRATALREALEAEEKREREKDRQYWLPLRAELEKLRHERLKTKDPLRRSLLSPPQQ